jgi:hypothetical protein
MTREFAHRCIDPATVPAAIKAQDVRRIEITSEQWRFLRGIYAMNVDAPPGLPYGENAVLAQCGDDSDGLLFFIEGDKTCAPMYAPPALFSLVEQVAMADMRDRH